MRERINAKALGESLLVSSSPKHHNRQASPYLLAPLQTSGQQDRGQCHHLLKELGGSLIILGNTWIQMPQQGREGCEGGWTGAQLLLGGWNFLPVPPWHHWNSPKEPLVLQRSLLDALRLMRVQVLRMSTAIGAHGRLRSSVSVARWMGRSQNFTCVTQLGPAASLIFSEKVWQCWGTCLALQHPRSWMQQGPVTLRAREAAKVLPSISELPKPLRLVLWWERNSESDSPEMVISQVVYKWG